MSRFSSLFTKSLAPQWSFACKATLWRILLGDRGRILGECRDQEKKKTEFFCLDVHTGSLLWNQSRPEEPWWIGLEAIHEDRVFLHGFETPDMPEHKRIIALDLDTGEEVWRNDEWTFWFAYGSKVYAYRTMFEKRAGLVLSLETGDLLEEIEEIEDLLPVRQLARGEDPHQQVDFPEFLDRDSAPADIISFMDRETKSREIIGGIEAILKDRYVVMSYHRVEKRPLPGEPLLESRIAVFDREEGRKVFSDVLLRNARAPVPDSFFLKNSSVFFIKDQHILTMLPLPH